MEENDFLVLPGFGYNYQFAVLLKRNNNKRKIQKLGQVPKMYKTHNEILKKQKNGGYNQYEQEK